MKWDRHNFCHFGLFFVLLDPWQPGKSKFWKNEKIIWRCHPFTHTKIHDHMMYVPWNTECDRLFVILGHFLHFTPLLTPIRKIWKNVKKPSPFALHRCTMNEDHIIYDSWDIRHNKEIFLSFWVIFCPLTLLTTQEIKLLKKIKKKKKKKKKMINLEILSFDTCVPQMMIWCMVPGIWSATDRIFLILDHFCPFTLQTNQKIKS